MKTSAAAVFNLPSDLFPETQTALPPVIIHDYTAEARAPKGRSILQKNAISLVVTGKKTMQFAEKTLYITSEDIHFISAGNCLASVNLSLGESFRSILLFFDDAVLTEFYLKYDSLHGSKKKSRRTEQQSFVSIRKNPFIRHYIASLDLLLKSGRPVSDAMMRLKLEELLLHLAEYDPEALRSFQPSKQNSFDDLEIRKAAEANIVSNITVEELAFLCNMSLSTFKRRFTKIYKTSPNRWLLQQRMKRAAKLLLHFREKPGEVYHKVGYENHSSFSQSFRQAYGMSPRDFQLKNWTSRDSF